MAYGDPLNSFSDYSQRTWKDLLARMIYSEARGESEEGKRGCAYVAQNRLDKQSTEFGLTMKEILLKSGQFEGMGTEHALKPDTDSEAWKVSLDIAMNLSSKANPIGSCLWFNTHAVYAKHIITDDTGITYYFFSDPNNTRAVIETHLIGGHTFFLLSGY